MTLYADANSSYDVPDAIRVGRLMEEHDYALLRGALPVRRPGGDQGGRRRPEDPGRRGRAGVQRAPVPLDDRQPGVDVVQPDLHYYGGFIRCMRVARMAARRRAALHAAHVGLGARLPRRGALRLVPRRTRPVHRVQGRAPTIPFACETSSLKCEDGMVRCRRARASASRSRPTTCASSSESRSRPDDQVAPFDHVLAASGGGATRAGR